MPPSLPADWPNLNPAQARAVTASLRPQLVVAGPGTGKTRVLVCRAAHLIDQRTPPITPSNLVLVTFTRRAAHQLTERLSALVGPNAQHVRAGTIHHFCYEILQTYPDYTSAPNDFIVVDDAATDAFWQRWYQANDDWCAENDLHSYGQVKTRVSRIKLGIDTVSGRLTQALRAYRTMLEERGALDFDDLLVETRDVLRNQPSVRRNLAADTDAILVDEFQDTDPVQFDIIRRLGEEGSHLFCVADDDQSVYRFRGARPENLKRYIDRFNCARERDTLHILSTNYRSNRSIFDVAETVLDRRDRLKEVGDVRTLDDDTNPVRLIACEDPENERSFVVDCIRAWIERGADRSELAVLTRWNRRLTALEQDVLEAGIACESSSSEDLLDTPPAQKLKALLHVVDARRRNRPIDAPMAQLLERMLGDRVTARVRDFRERRLSDASLWTAFQTIVSNDRARRNAGLSTDGGQDRLGRVYATITNLLQKTADETLAIGPFAREALHQLGDPLQLLAQYNDQLTDPQSLHSFRDGGTVLGAWREKQNEASPPRLLIHHRTPQITRLWRQFLRRALNIETDPPAPLPEAQEALFVRPADDGIPPLGANDVVLTTDLEGLLRWGRRTAAFREENETPRILLLSPDATFPSDRLALLGVDPDAVYPVDPSEEFQSPSVRLWKLLQATTGPVRSEPLFPEYVMVDLEATSLDPHHCRVAEIGALKVQDGTVVDQFSELVQLPDDLTADEEDTLRNVCGLDPDTDFTGADPLDEVWAEFCDFVDTAPLVAHNGQRYDFRVLRRLAKEQTAPARWATTYDLLPAAHELLPSIRHYDAESLRRELLNDQTETAHRALADCEDQQRILEQLQERRARRRRVLAHESLLPYLVAALTYESPPPAALSDDAQVLLQVGHTWSLRDASPAGDDLRAVLPRALPDRLRQHELYATIDEDALLTGTAGLQPGLADRLEALLAPFANEPVQSDRLDDLLTHLALWGDHTESSPTVPDDVVTLSTYHSAKGLEFDRVICMDAHDNAFPPYFARDPEERRESRRLLYVGMTRAKRHLILTYPRRERDFDRRPSPFLRDAPDALLKRVQTPSTG